MTQPRRRLGRGIEALLGATQDDAARGDGVNEIAVNRINPNPFQPRRTFDKSALEDLAQSIRSAGLMQPVVVRTVDADRFELIAGERRWRAVQHLGWARIHAVVRNVDDRTMLTLALIENLQRDDLSPIDTARGYQRLIDEFDLSQQDVATAVGRDRSTITNALRLLKLPGVVQAMLDEGKLTVGHARALLGLSDEDRIVRLARESASRGLSVRDVEDRVRKAKPRSSRPAPSSERETRPAEVRRVEDALRRRLQTDVSIQTRGVRGRIEVSYYSNDDLSRLLELILGEPYR